MLITALKSSTAERVTGCQIYMKSIDLVVIVKEKQDNEQVYNTNKHFLLQSTYRYLNIQYHQLRDTGCSLNNYCIAQSTSTISVKPELFELRLIRGHEKVGIPKNLRTHKAEIFRNLCLKVVTEI